MNIRNIKIEILTAVGLIAIFVGATLTSALCITQGSASPPVALMPPPTDVVTEWNQQAVTLTLLPASAQAPVQQTRTMAIVQVSVHDAVNGITRAFATYLSPGTAPAGASPEAAAIAAAHHALRNLFPGQTSSLDTAFTDSLAAHGLSPADPGIDYGRSAAAAVLAARASDGAAQAQYSYDAPGAGNPGVWERINNAPALLPGWGNVTTWVLRGATQFGPDDAPSLSTERYSKDYDEIKDIGALNSPTRTSEQTQIATFWRASPTAIWNPVIRQVVAERGTDISTNARTYALVYLAVADASVACWNAKYLYNFWRPQAAIRRGDEDGNDATAPDPSWTPLFATPPHPEFPSAHATNSAAMATTLGLIFGDEPGMPISVTISGITRQWNSFSGGVDEVIDARVYSGIHFRSTDEASAKQGRQIAYFVSTHALRPCRGRGNRCP